ncbi:hypothetical protein TGME49_292960 [Toxoplasma gondii ME49]|uniref:Uncharacterized protein n=8 Tax=Toxoplasma gondii TaxID=5811 RepID=A0A125YW28_TOXGG|nr:hypothetical protein TGME49_292960 [Toxoplasma gondii ME49]EPR57678.1 hypothetical protein TGGT1_292960 [Toxoplasma gondii GT1]ESS29336.1 putative transmembrane domain protein [Toxoplasma gondii VEG]KAF4646050.1 hypothetical protein TGRH88_018370 [Toxoplasma gondii]KFG35876.1 putative transmembrane domain protein [Toxoplasma gondii p89]KFH14446.1 putative transmembrane domain protein [Toxoplasma gondii MAS]PUA86964.1 putative transmembrane domain protein [Toxoplasma gondii TgCATBr9]RQX687|eukprot:XP_018638639.1 hypothetical protein TGME49_292960 [Toxoplasma gondii ME49]
MGAAWSFRKFRALVCVTWSTLWWVALLLSSTTSLRFSWHICWTAGLTARATGTLAPTVTEGLAQFDPNFPGRASHKRLARSAVSSRHELLHEQLQGNAYRGAFHEVSAAGKDHTPPLVPEQLTGVGYFSSFLTNSTAATTPDVSTTNSPYVAPWPLGTWLPQPASPAGPLSNLPLPHLPEVPLVPYVNTTAIQSPIATRIANALPFVNALPPPPLAPLPTTVVSNVPQTPASQEPVVTPTFSPSVPLQQSQVFQPKTGVPLATTSTPQSTMVTQPSVNQLLSGGTVATSSATRGVVPQDSAAVSIPPVAPLTAVPISSESQVRATLPTHTDDGTGSIAPESQPEETDDTEEYDVPTSDASTSSDNGSARESVTQLAPAEDSLQSPNSFCFDQCTCVPIILGGTAILLVSGVSVLAETILMSQLFSKGFFSKNFFRGGGWVILLASSIGLLSGGLLGGLVSQCWTSALFAGGGFMSFAVSFVLVGTRGAWIGGFGGSVAGGTIGGLASTTTSAVTIGLIFGLLAGIVIGFAPILSGIEMNARYIRWRTRAHRLGSTRTHTDDHRQSISSSSMTADDPRDSSDKRDGASARGSILSLEGISTRRSSSASVTGDQVVDASRDNIVIAK